MKITDVHVHGFRGILDAKATLQDMTLLVGANNAGKSTFVAAIRAFYGDLAFEPTRDAPKVAGGDGETWVEIGFLLIPAEATALKQEYRLPGDQLRIRRYFTPTKNSEGGDRVPSAYALDPNGEPFKEQFYGAKGVQEGKLGNLIFVPAVGTVAEATKLTGPSALREILKSVIDDIVESSPAYDQLKSNVASFYGSFRTESSETGHSIDTLEQRISTALRPWKARFEIRVQPPAPDDIVKTLFEHRCIDELTNDAPATDVFGSGFQRHLIASLVQVKAEVQRARAESEAAKKTKATFRPTFTLLIFEEPEAYLHPERQDQLCSDLLSAAVPHQWQVLCTTHSSSMISRRADAICSVVRVSRNEMGVMACHQIDETAWNSILDSNLEIRDIDELPQNDLEFDARTIEGLRYFTALGAERAAALFARRVLLVEGPSETVLLHRLVSAGVLKRDPGVAIIDTMGKYNMHRFMALFDRLGIEHFAMYDDDSNKGGKQLVGHKKLNALIESQRAKARARCGTIPLDRNLEAELGLEEVRGDLKPIAILCSYDAGMIDKEKLEAFCGKLRPILEDGERASHPRLRSQATAPPSATPVGEPA